MIRYYSLCLIVFLVTCSVLRADVRTWTDRGGKFQVEATLLDYDGKEVKLKKTEDGKIVTLALEKLSLPDQVYVRKTMDALGGGETKPEPPKSAKPAARPSTRKAEPEDEEDDSSDGSFRGKIPVTRLSAAPSIRTDLAKTSWSIKPDPAPLTELGFTPRPLSIPNGITDSQARVKDFSISFACEKPESLLLNQEIESGRKFTTIAMLVDAQTGAIRARAAWPAKLRSWGLSPDGTKALFAQNEETSVFDSFKHLTIADTTRDKMPCIGVMFPFAEKSSGRGSDRDSKIKRAAWVDNEHILVQSENDLLVLLRVADGSAVWTLDQGISYPFRVSPGGKYLVSPTQPIPSKPHFYCLMETLTGRPVGRLEFPTGYGKVIAPEFDFSPDGTTLAGFSSGTLYLWDVLTGKPREPVYCGNIPGARPIYWIGNDYVLAHSILVHVGQEIPIWKYEGTKWEDIVFGGLYWHIEKESRSRNYGLVPLKIPHAGMPALPKMSDEQKYCVRPGMSVAISIDPSIPDNAKLRTHLMEKLTANGLRIADQASLTLDARLTPGKEEEVYYSQHFRGNIVGHAKFRNYTFSFIFERDGEVLWQTSSGLGTPTINVSDLETKSLQQLVDEKSKPTSFWYFNVDFPKKLPFSKAGKSDIVSGGRR